MSMNIRKQKPSLLTLTKSFLIRHLQVLFFTLGQLAAKPVATLMTSASLGIALALPAGMNEILLSIENIGKNFEHVNHISIFLKKNLQEQAVKEVEAALKQISSINAVHHKNPAQALKEFQQYANFENALNLLDHNPLPHVFIVEPSLSVNSKQQLHQLLEQIKTIPHVESVQLDIKWLERLFSFIEIGRTGIVLIGSLLALAVVLIIGNTIRLAIENRKQEIIITKLIGATNSFVRRPFLYLGLCYGLSGSLVAIVFVDISITIISQPIDHLARLYQSKIIHLQLMSLEHSIMVVIAGVVLGIIGALIAVNYQLKNIEPS